MALRFIGDFKELEKFGFEAKEDGYVKSRHEDNGEIKIVTINELRQIHYYYLWNEAFLDDCYFDDRYIEDFDDYACEHISDLIKAGLITKTDTTR